jgi:hypothetical protein
MSQVFVPHHQYFSAQRPTAVPYVTAWTSEQYLSAEVVERPGWGIGYRDEMPTDRDESGVLWYQSPSHQGAGRPRFGDVHPLRQRRAMRRLLCQVCAGPADRNQDGVLWLMRDHREDWDRWPEGMAEVEPPICAPCVRMSMRLCPALRKGAVAVRVRECPIVGVRGALYRIGEAGPVAVGDAVVGFEDPAIRWVRAVGLVRQLRSCAFEEM